MKSQTQTLLALLLILTGMGLAGAAGTTGRAAPAASNAVPRVAVGVYQGAVLDQGLTDLVAVSLTGKTEIEVLERAEMGRIMAEWQRAGLSGDLARQVKLGRAAGVDYFVWVTLDANGPAGILEIAEAATGRSVISQRINTTPESLIREITEQVRRLMGKRAGPTELSKGGMVMSRPTVIPGTSNNLAATDRLLVNLADALIQNHVPLLHRRYAVDLITERWWAEKGVLALSAHRQALRGSRFLLTSRVSFEQSQPQLTLALVDSATGARIATRDFYLMEHDAVLVLPDDVATWVAGLVAKDRLGQESRVPAGNKGDRLQPETQKAFYQGVLLYNEGRFLDAIDFFALAHFLEPSFSQPVDWIRECFAAAGFGEVVKRIDQYIQEVSTHAFDIVPFYHNNWKRLTASPGINLLGLTCQEPGQQSQGVDLLRRLAVVLERQGAVFLPEDLGTLAMEYDTFVGLESVEGVQWKTAPLLLFENMVSAHLSRTDNRLVLEMVRVQKLDPESCRYATVQLADDPAKWDILLSCAVKQLFEEPVKRAGASGRMPLKIAGSLEDLKKELQQQYRDSTYLKLLRKDPAHPFLDVRFPCHRSSVGGWDSMGWGRYAVMGLQEYILRSSRDENLEKAWQEMAILTRLNPTGYGSANPEGVRRLTMPELIMRMQQIAERYPSHPAGLAARYNVVLWDLRPSNYRQSRKELADILQQVESQYKENYEGLALTVMRSTLAALSLALGEPIDPLMKGYDFRGILLAISPGTFDSKPATWSLFPPPSLMHEWHNMSPAAARQAAPLYLYLLPEMLKIPSVVQPSLERARFILECAPDLPLARDMVAKAIWDCMHGDMDDDEYEEFTALCEDYAQALVGYFSEPRPRPGPFRPTMWIEPFFGQAPFYRGLTLRRMYWLPESSQERLEHSAEELESAVLKAVAEKRITDNSFIQYLTRAGLLKPREETEQTMLTRAEEEWKRFHYPGRSWFAYMEWKKLRVNSAEWVSLCRMAYERLQATQNQWPKNSDTMRVYAYLGIEFFRAGEDDLAEQIHSEMILWKDVKLGKYESDFRPHARCMLVLIAHRQGDIPKAFRLAQQGLDALEGKSENGQLWFGISGASGGLDTVSAVERLRGFITQARANPSLLYEDPFDTFEKWQRKRDPTTARLVATNNPIVLPQGARPVSRQPWLVPGLGATLVWLEPGSFIMGDKKWDWSVPLTRVILSRGFWIGQYEVRLQDWLQVMDYNPNGIQDDQCLPVERISWFDAMDFCRRLTARERSAGRLPEGYVYRLPTEAEWEYACRAGSTTSRSSEVTEGNLGEYAWHKANSGNRIHPVGSKRPNAWGLFDMMGNVSEWCFDRFGRMLPGGEVVDPSGPARWDYTLPDAASSRVVRGGDAETDARYQDSAFRHLVDPSHEKELAEFMGFRMVLAPDLVGK